MRALVVVHRWLGVAFCLLFAMWFVSGIVMHFVAFPALTEAERVAGLMTRQPRMIGPERLAIDCIELMENAPKVTQLLVVDVERRLVGALHMHDLFRARVV